MPPAFVWAHSVLGGAREGLRESMKLGARDPPTNTNTRGNIHVAKVSRRIAIDAIASWIIMDVGRSSDASAAMATAGPNMDADVLIELGLQL